MESLPARPSDAPPTHPSPAPERGNKNKQRTQQTRVRNPVAAELHIINAPRVCTLFLPATRWHGCTEWHSTPAAFRDESKIIDFQSGLQIAVVYYVGDECLSNAKLIRGRGQGWERDTVCHNLASLSCNADGRVNPIVAAVICQYGGMFVNTVCWSVFSSTPVLQMVLFQVEHSPMFWLFSLLIVVEAHTLFTVLRTDRYIHGCRGNARVREFHYRALRCIRCSG